MDSAYQSSLAEKPPLKKKEKRNQVRAPVVSRCETGREVEEELVRIVQLEMSFSFSLLMGSPFSPFFADKPGNYFPQALPAPQDGEL